VNAALVLVPVSVTDETGAIVTDLQIGDFEVWENGGSVPIARIGEPGEAELELAMLFDVSGSVHPRFELERQAAAHFLRTVLRPVDVVTIIAIGNQPKTLCSRTSTLQVALDSLARIEPATEATAFFDAAVSAARMLARSARPETRRVMIVLSDGEDNLSTEFKIADALRELEESDCLFYSVNPSGRAIRINKIGLRAQEAMEQLANRTGGASFVADRIEDLDVFYGRIAAELQGQYLLGYYSPAPPETGGYRRIEVRIPTRPKLRVRARQGYYAGRHPAGTGQQPPGKLGRDLDRKRGSGPSSWPVHPESEVQNEGLE